MYRIEGITDLIIQRTAEADNVLNSYTESRDAAIQEILLKGKDDPRETKLRMRKLINNSAFKELPAVFRIIDKHNDSESATAALLLSILIHELSQSIELWRKIIFIIDSSGFNHSAIDGLNKFLRRKCVMKHLSELLEQFFKSLCQVGENEFYIDIEAVQDEKKLKLFKSLEVHHVAIVINHILNLPETSQFFSNKIFTDFELSSSFKKYLKLVMRNLNL
jgi:hypothetical protein